MSQNAVVEASTTRSTWCSRVHGALMPDYNRAAATYWWTMVLLGAMLFVHAAVQVARMPSSALLQTLLAAVAATLAGFFPVRIPRSKNSFAAGEIFIFIVLLMQGPAAATVAAAGEAAVGSYRTSRRWTSRIASPAMAAVAMATAGSMLQGMLDLLHHQGWYSDGAMLGAAMVFAVVYFVLNTVFVTLVPHLKRGEGLSLAEVFGAFGWVGITYAGSALVAGLLYLTVRQSGLGVLMAALPIIGMLMATLHFFFRQQEADEVARRDRVEAAEREASQAARHVHELAASEQRFHRAFTHASIGMALVSFDGTIRQVNRALLALLGGEAESQPLNGRRLEHIVHAGDALELEAQVGRVEAGRIESFTSELRCRHHAGHDVWVALHGSVFSAGEPGSETSSLILQVQDISARRDAEARLQHIAFHDGLTGLPNRSRFHEMLAQAITHARGDARRSFAVMFLDFDRFKLINDSLGHGVGDQFLTEVARRIRDSVRPGDVVARLGGDEFAVLCEGLSYEVDAVQLAERMQALLRQPIRIADTEIATSASIGITFSAVGYTQPDEVLRDADIAMYKAKAEGKARYALFDAGLRQQASERMSLEGDLRRALDAGGLSVVYQPLYRLGSGRLEGFEALARWQHPQLGAIAPDVFIPIAEEAALMAPLTDFVLDRACRQLREWQQRSPDFEGLKVQVNISGNDMAHGAFAQRIEQAIRNTGLDPTRLTLELTENTLMERVDGAMDSLAVLQKLGVGLSIDDFGTGYSSLSYLSSLPIDSLKIDRSFVQCMRAGSTEAEVVRAIVSLGASLGKKVIAEGIETPSQLDQLREMGCQSGQGYHLSRPLSPEAVETLLDRIEIGHLTGRSALEARPALH